MAEARFEDVIVVAGDRYHLAWYDPPFVPPLAETTQALGICFTFERRIVMVTWDGQHWTLPGGTIEPGETLEQALSREVREEACARVRASAYLGCQRVTPLDGDPTPYYQTRFWARVELAEFRPEHEMIGRRLVSPEEFGSVLFWGDETSAAVILQHGLAIEREHRIRATSYDG
jgi:ADP-ribose pyrophosphatase YjhB (NUDIX family)